MQGSRRVPLDLAHPGRVFILTAAAVLVIDQLTKFVVRSTMALEAHVPLWQNVFRLTYVHNPGAAFGLFPGGRPVFILTTMLVLFVVAAYWRRVRPTQWPVVIALALVTAGALGNLIDRAALGFVTDFFDFNLIDFPVFNVADSAVVVGVIMLMGWILFGPEPAGGRATGGSEAADASDEPDDGTSPQTGADADGPSPAETRVDPSAARPHADTAPEVTREGAAR